MKVKLGSLLILILFPLTLFSATHYVSANTGNDTNGGTGWGDAWLTIGKAITDGLSAADIVVCVGTFTEEVATAVDGTSGNKITFIDSLRFTDGINFTNPDTVWTAVISNNGGNYVFDVSNDNFQSIVGFDISDSNISLINNN